MLFLHFAEVSGTSQKNLKNKIRKKIDLKPKKLFFKKIVSKSQKSLKLFLSKKWALEWGSAKH